MRNLILILVMVAGCSNISATTTKIEPICSHPETRTPGGLRYEGPADMYVVAELEQTVGAFERIWGVPLKRDTRFVVCASVARARLFDGGVEVGYEETSLPRTRDLATALQMIALRDDPTRSEAAYTASSVAERILTTIYNREAGE